MKNIYQGKEIDLDKIVYPLKVNIGIIKTLVAISDGLTRPIKKVVREGVRSYLVDKEGE